MSYPIHTPAHLRTLLARIEVADCDCEFTFAVNHDGHERLMLCTHVLDAPEHLLSLGEWAELLAKAYPGAYAEPAAEPMPSRVLTRAARVAVYAERHAAGQRLWHEGDGWQRGSPRRGVQMDRRAQNGSDREKEIA